MNIYKYTPNPHYIEWTQSQALEALLKEWLSGTRDSITEDLEEMILDELDADSVGRLFRAVLSKKNVESTYEVAMSIIDTYDDKGSSPLWSFMNNRFDEIEEAYR